MCNDSVSSNFTKFIEFLFFGGGGGTWVAQSVKCLTLAQVMISQLVGSSPALGSVLTAQSLEPVSDSVSLFLCPSTPLKNK